MPSDRISTGTFPIYGELPGNPIRNPIRGRGSSLLEDALGREACLLPQAPDPRSNTTWWERPLGVILSNAGAPIQQAWPPPCSRSGTFSCLEQ